MGSLPCYQKVLDDGRIQSLLQTYIAESKLTTGLLAAKGYYDSPILGKFIALDQQVTDFMFTKLGELQNLNNSYSLEE